MRGDMGKMNIPEPQTVKPEEAFPDADRLAHDMMQRLGLPPTMINPAVFPGLDSIVVDWKSPKEAKGPPWARPEFLSRHFELVGWETWRWWPVAVPGTEDVNSAREAVSISIFRLCNKPVIMAMTSPWPWWIADPAVVKERELRFYRLKWHLWWRRVDPMKDAKLRAILEGAVALDALAGRDP